MKNHFYTLLFAFYLCIPNNINAQDDPNDIGAWYMYIFETRFQKDSLWGVQGDVQHRNYNVIGDLQQLLLRGGITYRPKESKLKFFLGYAFIIGEKVGDSREKTIENRFFPEASFPIKLGKGIYSSHRFRYEIRFIENQDLRTRYRYGMFFNIPLNKPVIEPKTTYLSLYNEIFINGQRHIGDGKTVPFFDRNRLYGALGYFFKKGLKMQLGLMRQTSNTSGKNQLQLSLHHNF